MHKPLKGATIPCSAPLNKHLICARPRPLRLRSGPETARELAQVTQLMGGGAGSRTQASDVPPGPCQPLRAAQDAHLVVPPLGDPGEQGPSASSKGASSVPTTCSPCDLEQVSRLVHCLSLFPSLQTGLVRRREETRGRSGRRPDRQEHPVNKALLRLPLSTLRSGGQTGPRAPAVRGGPRRVRVRGRQPA